MADMVRLAFRITLFFMSACWLLWAAAPSLRTVAAGLILGIAVSYTNTVLLRRRVEKLGEFAVGGRKAGVGMTSRIATVLIGVMAAVRFPEVFNLPATISTSFLLQLAMPLIGLYFNKRQDR